MNKQDFNNTMNIFLSFCSFVDMKCCPKDLRDLVHFNKPDSRKAFDLYRWIPIKLASALRTNDGESREYKKMGLNDTDIKFIVDERNHYAHPKNFSPNFKLNIKVTIFKMWNCLKKISKYFK